LPFYIQLSVSGAHFAAWLAHMQAPTSAGVAARRSAIAAGNAENDMKVIVDDEG